METSRTNSSIVSGRSLVWIPLCGLAGLLAAAGCRQNSTVEVSSTPIGEYALVSVDQHALPYTTAHAGAQPTIKSGSLSFSSDGICVSKVTFSLPGREDASRSVKATYTRRDANLVLSWEGAGTTTATLQGNTLVMNNEGMLFAYRK